MSLIKLLAKAMRRYDRVTMLILADLCEERELHEIARELRLVYFPFPSRETPIQPLPSRRIHLIEEATLESFLALYKLRDCIRHKRPTGDAMIRYAKWTGEIRYNSGITSYQSGQQTLQKINRMRDLVENGIVSVEEILRSDGFT